MEDDRYIGQRSRDSWGEIHARRMTEATGWAWRYIGTGGGCVALVADVIGIGSLMVTDGWGEDIPNAGGLHCLHRMTRDASGVVDRNGAREFPNRRALVAYIAGGVEWVGGSWF